MLLHTVQRRRALLAAVAVLGAAAFQAPAAASTVPAEPAGEVSDEPIRVAIPADSGGTDPVAAATGPPSNPMRGNVVEMLFRSGRGSEIEPWLVESYEVSDDLLEYTMTLREGVSFHDGTPLTSEAVKWSLERAADEQFAGFSTGLATGPIASIEVVDDVTFVITVSAPTPDLEGRLATVASAILSPAGAEQSPNTYEAYVAPVGTGPYRFVERVPDERYVFERFDDYWGGPSYFAGQEWMVVPEAATRESLVLAGDADVAVSPPLADLSSLGSNDSVQVLTEPTARLIAIQMNVQDPAFSDVRVREALNLAVDKQAIIDTVMFGTADIADATVANAIDPSCEAPGPWPFDPERAQALLEEAGADLSITLTTPGGRYVQDAEAANAVAAYLREVGVDVEVEVVDTARFFEILATPIDSVGPRFMLTGSAPAYADGGFALAGFVPSGFPPDGTNYSFVDSAAVTESYDAANALLGDERQAAFCETATLVWEEIPSVYLWTQRFPVIAAADLAGIAVEFDERLDVVGASSNG
jgi:peptide/nickel transport system substrate-binding protein